MEKIEAMDAFVKVVALGSYSEAARRLGVTRSAVSKAVSELEGRLGARLLDRTTRRVSPTEAGSTFYERCVAILEQVAASEAEVSRLHEEPRGLLRVNGPMSFGTLYLGAAVVEFMKLYPELRVDLDLTDRFIDPLEERVDVTVRIGLLADSSLIARKIAGAPVVTVASPDYLARRGTPETPEELADHDCLDYGRHSPAARWAFQRDGAVVHAPIRTRLASNNGQALLVAALNGLGVARLPTFIAGLDVEAGRLTAILGDFAPPERGVYALYAQNRFLPTKVRIFIDFLAGRFSGRAWAQPPEPHSGKAGAVP